MTSLYTLRYFFDHGSGTILWSSNPAAHARFGYAIHLAALPIPEQLRERAQALCTLFDTSLNPTYPPDPSPWRAAECAQFNKSAEALFAQLCEALAPTFLVTNAFEPLTEDPDLDRYLADPKTFRR